MNCPQDEVPDNTILRPIAFASKSPSTTERRYININREVSRILHDWKSSTTMFHAGAKSPQVNCRYLQKGHSDPVPKTTVHMAENSLIQDQDNLQAWTRTLHS